MTSGMYYTTGRLPGNRSSSARRSLRDRARDLHRRLMNGPSRRRASSNHRRVRINDNVIMTGSNEALPAYVPRRRYHSEERIFRPVENNFFKPEGTFEDDFDESVEDVRVESVDLLPSLNAHAHHTDKFDRVRDGHLIVRRGQAFNIVVNFTGKFQLRKHTLRIVFKTGQTPRPGKGTHVQCVLSSKPGDADWSAVVMDRPTKFGVQVAITPPSDCVVSDWNLVLESIVNRNGRPKAYKYLHPELIYMLFNPWCKEDVCFFEETRYLSEYILNDSGAIFHGNYKQIGAKPWFFGQFEDGMLEAALYCVKKGFKFLTTQYMGDPIRVTRIISKIVNSQDDEGVLVGNWGEDFTGGKSPMAWSGSVSILRQFIETKKPVKFGQCFVFSGIVTTICRALGIPCRTVTNFASAHDTDGSVTIDSYWDLDQKEAISGIGDSIWNFHCWNDVWIQRDDLPYGYSGWQVVDSTPQERSEGMFQCGPTSLRAVKSGKCDLLYDTPFVFAEVNADRVNWTRDKEKQWTILNVNTSAIGKKISTKVPDGKPVKPYLTSTNAIRQDITADYKYPEDTERERMAVITAGRSSIKRKPVYNTETQDVTFGGFMDRDMIPIGQDIDVKMTFCNNSQSRRTLQGKIMCETVSYVGERLTVIKKQEFTTFLRPLQDDVIEMIVHWKDYMGRLSEQGAMKIIVCAKVLETGQVHVWQDDFRLRRPDIYVEILASSARTGKSFECRLSFTNPLPTVLNNCTLTVEGAGIDVDKDFNITDVGARETWIALMTLTPKKPGHRQISVTFNSDQLKDVSGVTEIDIIS